MIYILCSQKKDPFFSGTVGAGFSATARARTTGMARRGSKHILARYDETFYKRICIG